MPEELRNPFISNTPSSSPVKPRTAKNRVSKHDNSSSSTLSSVHSSPVRRPRSNNGGFTDRFLPNRTDMDLKSVISVGSSNLPSLPASNSDNHLEFRREQEAHETFDAVLKNELFGEKLCKDSNETGNSIDRIKYTSSSSFHEPTTPPRSHETFEREALLSPTNSSPATPRRLTFDHHQKPSTSTMRGASLLTYCERKASRPSTASLIQTQFNCSASPVRPDSKKLLLLPSKKTRQIAKIPYRVLDAPSLADDFYYDLIDWSSTDILAVALGKSIFLTDNKTSEVAQLATTDDEYTSLSWVGAGSHLAVGQLNGLVKIFDVEKKKCIRTLPGHIDRVACLSWNNHVLSSGSRDRRILHRDVRTPDPCFEEIHTHTQEVCGLKWNVEENKMASGGNDNLVFVYDGTSRSPILKLSDHTAAVKAIAWSPHKRGILATGGGTADKKLKIWNVRTATKLHDVDTASQVCNMVWSKNTNEIVTSHGYSKYNLTLWDGNTMDPVAILKGHSFRVLHMTLSADGTTIVSGAGDETLRYWKLFEKSKPQLQPASALLNAFSQLR
ncbi:LANO_0F07030g1_1 [Lachancea nothofagi CBS 11611]|uniref:LANO_0F07030g1_1 n=1 Tax=Lachancea nothofagi CBS 11611 TaxID=1266666 RepID=A0A1G4K8V9_9SACH|nr:LANO_0F07030g1_1 [Lachancea nothofagi CBS 11611]